MSTLWCWKETVIQVLTALNSDLYVDYWIVVPSAIKHIGKTWKILKLFLIEQNIWQHVLVHNKMCDIFKSIVFYRKQLYLIQISQIFLLTAQTGNDEPLPELVLIKFHDTMWHHY